MTGLFIEIIYGRENPRWLNLDAAKRKKDLNGFPGNMVPGSKGQIFGRALKQSLLKSTGWLAFKGLNFYFSLIGFIHEAGLFFYRLALIYVNNIAIYVNRCY